MTGVQRLQSLRLWPWRSCKVLLWVFSFPNCLLSSGHRQSKPKLLDRQKAFNCEAAEVAQVIQSGDSKVGMRILEAGTRFAEATQAVVMTCMKWGAAHFESPATQGRSLAVLGARPAQI